MVIAAVASLAAAAQAGIRVTNCNARSLSCPVVAYKVTASGKIAAPVEKKDSIYKTVSKLSIKKGALIIFPTSGSGKLKDDDCCYEAYSLYLQVKVNKETYPVGVFFQPLDSWTVFGKGYQQYLDAQGEKSKKAKVESEIGLSYAVSAGLYGNGIATSDATGVGAGADTVTGAGLEIDLGLSDFAFIATAFGKGTYKYSYSTSGSACSICESEDSDFTPGNYSGWFAGLFEGSYDAETGCLTCECSSLDVFGGTWKAKYQKNWSKDAEGWQSAASYVFGASTLNEMKYGPDADADTKREINKTKEWVIE